MISSKDLNLAVSKLCFSYWIEYKLTSTMQNAFFFLKWSFFFQALRNAIYIIFGFPEGIIFPEGL